MQPTRMIFEDTPAFVPIPADLQHRRSEVIVWPLEADDRTVTEPAPMPVLPSLAEFRATLSRQDVHAGEFCRLMRDEDRY